MISPELLAVIVPAVGSLAGLGLYLAHRFGRRLPRTPEPDHRVQSAHEEARGHRLDALAEEADSARRESEHVAAGETELERAQRAAKLRG